MLGLIAKKLSQQKHLFSSISSFSGYFKAFVSSTTYQSDSKGDDFTLSYLVNSCGVAVDAANKISKKIHLESAEKPSRTINFLQSYGFTDAQICSIVTFDPNVLHCDPVKTLKPKFDLFTSIGASHDSLLKIIRNCPRICLEINLKESLVPALDLIRSVVSSNEELLIVLTRYRILQYNLFRSLGPNVAFLGDIGMSERRISKFLMLNCYSFLFEPAKFKLMADRALAMGFDVESTNFGGAVNSFIALTREKWQKKVETFQKWGWSDSEFNEAFKKQPRIMLLSKANIEGTMDYWVNTMRVDASYIVRNPNSLLLSLKKRVIPRFYVVQALLSKGLIEKDYSIQSAFMSSDEHFLKAFVEKYPEVRYELLALYHSQKH